MSKRARQARAKRKPEVAGRQPEGHASPEVPPQAGRQPEGHASSEVPPQAGRQPVAEASPAPAPVEEAKLADEAPPPPSRSRVETPVAFATPEPPSVRDIPRDDGSLSPLDLDSEFFHASIPAEAEPAPELHEVERRPNPLLSPAVARRRAHLTRYVRVAVGAASALCLAALVKVAVARNDTGYGARVAAASVVHVTPPSDVPQAAAMPEVAPSPVAEPSPGIAAVAAPEPASAPAPEPPAAAAPAPASVPASEPGSAPAPDPAAAVPAPQAAPDPKAAAVEKRSSQVALERGKVADAIAAGERSVALDPTDAEAWLILGAAYQEKGDGPSARKTFRACLDQGKRGPRWECAQMPH